MFSIGDDNFGGGIVVFANETSGNNLYTVTLAVGPNVTRSTFDYDVSTFCYIILLYNNIIVRITKNCTI